jgi:hypothetical protein
MLLLAPYYRWQNWSTERLRTLLNITQLVNGKLTFQTRPPRCNVRVLNLSAVVLSLRLMTWESSPNALVKKPGGEQSGRTYTICQKRIFLLSGIDALFFFCFCFFFFLMCFPGFLHWMLFPLIVTMKLWQLQLSHSSLLLNTIGSHCRQ